MTSNQDIKQEEIPILITGIEVMKDLSIDANKMFQLVREGLLLPRDPKDPLWIKLQMNSRCDPPEYTLSRWTYWKSHVEEFKLRHKVFLEQSRNQIVAEEGKNGDQAEDTRDARVKKLPNNPKRLQEQKDRDKAEKIANRYIAECKSKGEIPRIYEAVKLIEKEGKLSREYTGKNTIHNWIKKLFPEESRKEGQGRPIKE